jgi:hypothetical protein
VLPNVTSPSPCSSGATVGVVRSAVRLALLALTALCCTWIFGATSSQAGTLGNALFHHGFHVDEQTPSENPVADRWAGEMGADTIRIHTYWPHYQTGPSTYNEGWLTGIIERVKQARAASGDGSIKALVQFDLPTTREAWMESAGYGLVNQQQRVNEHFFEQSTVKGVARFYPTTAKGLEAYGLAMAKALKALSEAGVAEYIETPNEPNLIGGPSEVIDAAKVGQLGGWAVSEAAKIGFGFHSFSGGPAILIGSISGETSVEQKNGFEYANPAEFFAQVQYYADLTIEQVWASQPEIAGGLKQQWRPSFHVYPKSGGVEEAFCEHSAEAGKKTQDQAGDTSYTAAYGTVTSKLTPLVNAITNGKHWWISETGMSSYKTNNSKYEGNSECYVRREAGGSAYGKTQQSEFVAKIVKEANSQIGAGSGLWSHLEGITFFRPIDIQIGQFAGFGFYCGNFAACFQTPKPAATTFLQYYGSPVWHLDNLGEKAATSDPDASSWGPYRLDFFVKGAKNELRHKAYTGAAWTEWETIPGGPELKSGPGAVSWGSNRIDVAAQVLDGSIGHWATANGGASWAYDNLGEKAATSDPDVSSWGTYRLDFFVRGPKNELRHKAYTGTEWTGWETISGGPALTSAPTAVSWSANRIDVAARVEGGSVGHWATANGGASWAYDNLGGNIVGAPDVSSHGAYTLDFFGRSPENKLMRKSYNGVGWTEWETVPVGSLFSGPGAVSWNKERSDVVGRTEDGSIAHWAGTP